MVPERTARIVLGGAGALLGSTFTVMGLAHAWAVTTTAFEERGGLDDRWGTLMAVGFALVVMGATLAAAATRVLRGSRLAAQIALASTLFLTGFTAWTAAAFSPGPPIAFATYALAWGLMGRRFLSPSALSPVASEAPKAI